MASKLPMESGRNGIKTVNLNAIIAWLVTVSFRHQTFILYLTHLYSLHSNVFSPSTPVFLPSTAKHLYPLHSISSTTQNTPFLAFTLHHFTVYIPASSIPYIPQFVSFTSHHFYPVHATIRILHASSNVPLLCKWLLADQCTWYFSAPPSQ